MSKYLKRNVHTIFLMLGNGCNMNCAYCLQHPLVHEPLKTVINPEIFDFMEELLEESGESLHLQFFGGEPLLYFDAIKKIVVETKKREMNVSYGIISNGRAITDEMVRFFNAYNIPMGVSWDGPHVLETRGFDVFADEATRERLLALNQLSLSAVLSSKAYPKEILEAFQEISEEYCQIHGYHVGVNIDEIMDTGIANKWLLDVDYDRIYQEMDEMSRDFMEHIGKPVSQDLYSKHQLIGCLVDSIKHFYLDNKGKWDRYTVYCGNGFATLNLDMEGNLYPCHNTSVKAGNIKDGYFKYLQKILETDHTREYRETCLQCPALAYCQGGCKMVGAEAREKTYCRLKQAVFLPVLLNLQNYGAKLLEVEDDKERED